MKIDIFFVLGFLAALIPIPLVSIWALNTLFNTGIAYTFGTWFAALWIHLFIASVKVNHTKNS